MEHSRIVKLVSSDDWIRGTSASGEQIVRLLLLDYDVRSVQIAYSRYERAIAFLNPPTVNGPAVNVAIDSARTFVCSVRRFARLFEALAAERAIFPPDVGQGISLLWRKRRSRLNEYKEPRNAIEHVESGLSGKVNWILFNLVDNGLQCGDTTIANVTAASRDLVVGMRRELFQLIREHMPHWSSQVPPPAGVQALLNGEGCGEDGN